MLTRRQFLQVGLAGAGLLAVAGFLYRAGGGPRRGELRFLDARTERVVAALVPVVLAGTLPTSDPDRAQALREVIEAFDRAVTGLSPPVQEEIGQLLGLLAFPPTRLLLAGLTSPWEGATADEVSAFLSRWRGSRFGLMRSGYQALTQLLQAAWYGNPRAWPAIGYPGPPAFGEAATR